MVPNMTNVIGDAALSSAPEQPQPQRPWSRRAALAGVASAVLVGCTSGVGAPDAVDGSDDGADGPGSGRSESSTPGTTVASSAPSGQTVESEPPIDVSTRSSDVHLLRRMTFGPTTAGIAELADIGHDAWLSQQLGAGAELTDVDQVIADAYPQLEWSASELIDDFSGDGNAARVAGAFSAATFIRHSESPAQLFERMVEFWGDHFNVPMAAPQSIALRIEMDRTVIRPHAVVSFSDLLVATAQSPAMLAYLDNFRSTAGAINENYARELLELHTVGVGGGYDEDDIVSVARLLTGWGINRRERTFRFSPSEHDDGPLSMLGWDRPNTGDPFEHGVEFLQHLARLPATARYVSRKMAVRFVADEPDPDLVDAMAAAWLANDSAIEPVLRAMVDHAAFDAAPPKFNRPWDYLTQTVRAIDGRLDPGTETNVRDVIGAIRDLGQMPFRWASPDGYPDTEAAWLNGGGLLTRWNLAVQISGPDNDIITNKLSELAASLDGLSAAEIVDTVVQALRHAAPTELEREVLETLTGWSPDHTPSHDEIELMAPAMAAVVLATPAANYR